MLIWLIIQTHTLYVNAWKTHKGAISVGSFYCSTAILRSKVLWKSIKVITGSISNPYEHWVLITIQWQLVNKNSLNKNFLITRTNYSIPSTNCTWYFNWITWIPDNKNLKCHSSQVRVKELLLYYYKMGWIGTFLTNLLLERTVSRIAITKFEPDTSNLKFDLTVTCFIKFLSYSPYVNDYFHQVWAWLK